MDKLTRILFIVILSLSVAGLITLPSHQVMATRICNPFTTDPNPGMLALGTEVQFAHWEANGLVQREGVVVAYYIQSCFPGGGSIIGLNPEAYVIDYNDPQSRVVLNLEKLVVLDERQDT